MKLQTFVFSVLILCSLSTFAQLTIKTVDPGPYTPGSSIAATFSFTGVRFKADNKFELYISNENGAFVSTTPIGRFEELYSSFVNGVIPTTAVAGTNYKLRVRSTNPVLSSESTTFEVKAGTPVNAEVSSFPILKNNAYQVVFGYCIGRDNSEFQIQNISTSTASVSGTITNEITNTIESTLNFGSSPIQFNARLAHYTLFIKATMPGGTISTRAYMIVNNSSATSFTNNGPGIVCLPGGTLDYSVDLIAMKNNFPGNTYEVLWGDGKNDIYTIYDLSIPLAPISHKYLKTSCGTPPYIVNGATTYNVFGINISAQSPYCSGVIGRAINTTAKVVTKPKNDFTSPLYGCSKSEITFTNTSTPGQDPTGNSVDCKDNTIRYNWYVDGTLIKSNLLLTDVFKYTFEKGTYTVTLKSVSSGSCEGDPISKTICIQDPPAPSFTLPATVGCASSFTLTPTNTSVIDVDCTNDLTYLWTVSPATGVNWNGTLATSATPPNLTFNNPGVYTIGLRITSGSCGVYNSPSQTVTVNNLRTVTLSQDVSLCTPGVFSFSTATGPTQTTYSGSEVVLDDVYSWTVTSANGGTSNFVTLASSKYPQIEFNSFDIYTVTSTVTNVCGTRNDSQVITFIQSPIPGVTSPTDPICQNASANLTGTIAGTYTTFQWIGAGTFSTGAGPFPPSQSANLLSSYTPSVAERAAGSATIKLRINTGLGGTCAQIDKTYTVGIVRQNFGTDKLQTICSGSNALLNLVSTVAGSNYTWAAALSSGNATFNASRSAASGGRINEIITNPSNTTAAVVVYTITPISFGCSGAPFTFTVTVDPVLTATTSISTPVICSGATTGITLVPSVAGTKFTWTSTSSSAQLTGNSIQATAKVITSLNDVLINIGTTTETITYTFTPITSNGCLGTPISQIVQVYPRATPSNAGADAAICGIVNGTSSFTLSANQPSVGTGSWSIVSVQTDVVFANITDPKTSVSNLRNGEIYTFRWTISIPNGCAASSDDVKITVVRPTIAGTAGGDATVCASGNTGTVSLSGQTGNPFQQPGQIPLSPIPI